MFSKQSASFYKNIWIDTSSLLEKIGIKVKTSEYQNFEVMFAYKKIVSIKTTTFLVINK